MLELENPLKEEKLMELLENKDNSIVREKIIIHNLKLVKFIAGRFKNEYIDQEDLFQEGVIGLIKAIDDYDKDKGPFGAYASLHIKGAIYRAISNKSRVIRVPEHMVSMINDYRKKREELTKVLERNPRPEEMALYMKIDISKIYEIMELLYTTRSLDEVIGGEDDDLILIDIIPDNSPSMESTVEGKVFIDQFIKEFKPKLKEAQFESIRLFYGLDCPEHTLKEIADKYNFTLEYIRGERNKGLRKIRASRFMAEIAKELDEGTSFISGIDYSRPRVQGGTPSSPVERIAMEREWRANKMLRDKYRQNY